MRNDPQNPGNTPKSQSPNPQQAHERVAGKQPTSTQGKGAKTSKAKDSSTRSDDRNSPRSH